MCNVPWRPSIELRMMMALAVAVVLGYGQGRPGVSLHPLNLLKEYLTSVEDLHNGNASNEFLVDESIIYGPSSGNEYTCAVTFDGTNYLVVWADDRNGSSWDIYGARMSIGGVLIDSAGFVIAADTADQRWPSATFDGRNHLVTWADSRSGTYDIYGTRVSTGGVVLDTAAFSISSAINDQLKPCVAFDGSNFMVAWQDARSGSHGIYTARVTPQGGVLDTSGIGVSSSGSDLGFPSIGFDGANFLVVWGDERRDTSDIYGARVSQGGVVIDTSGLAISTSGGIQWLPSVAFGDSGFFVVWIDWRSGDGDIYGARVNRDGAVLDPDGLAVSTAASWQGIPQATYNGAAYLVAWEDYRGGAYDIYSARVVRDGTVLDPAGIPVSTALGWQRLPGIACDGEDCFIVWEDRRSIVSSDIYGARVSRDGVVLDPVGVVAARAAYGQVSSAVASTGQDYLVVWQDARSASSWDIYGTRVARGGGVLDSASLAISTASANQEAPSIAYDGTNYLTVWQDYRSEQSWDLYGARISRGGTVLDPSGRALIWNPSSWEIRPQVCFDGLNYMIAWERGSRDIWGVRVNQSGVTLDSSGFVISDAVDAQCAPAIAADVTGCLAVWTDYRNGLSDVYGARINRSGVVIDTLGIAICAQGGDQEEPALAFDGTNYLVVWQDSRAGDYDICGARVTTNGVVLDPSGITISAAAEDQVKPQVAFDGFEYVVIWQDRRTGGSWDIAGARVDVSGMVRDSFMVCTRPGEQYSPTAAFGSEECIVTYPGWCDRINGRRANALRIWGRCISSSGFGTEGEGKRILDQPRVTVHPNPFREHLVINLSPVYGFPSRLKIFDVSGRIVKSYDSSSSDMQHSLTTWPGADESGAPLPPGVYFVGVEVGLFRQIVKVVKIR